MFLPNLGITRKAALKISIIGGSNSVMRRGYAKYLNSYLGKATSRPTNLKYYSLGGVPNIFGVIQEGRYDIASNSDVIFFEYCVNDRHAIEIEQYSLELAGKSLEGFIRKAQKSNPKCIIVILIFGINLDNFYNNHCFLSELYQSVGDYYSIPVINLTELLSKKGLNVKSLYNDKDRAHYTRPGGVQIVSEVIVEELQKLGIINRLRNNKRINPKNIPPIYLDNLENLSFLEDFEGNYFLDKPKISVYRNTVFKEKNLTIEADNRLNFLLKGKLLAIYIKSDLNDGFIEIEFDSQKIVTSSYSSWVNTIKPQNVLNLIALPMRRFSESEDFAPVSISVCQEYPQDFELGFNKTVPTKDPQKWKLSIVGIAYTGEIKEIE